MSGVNCKGVNCKGVNCRGSIVTYPLLTITSNLNSPCFPQLVEPHAVETKAKAKINKLINMFLTIAIVNCSFNNPDPDVANANDSNRGYNEIKID